MIYYAESEDNSPRKTFKAKDDEAALEYAQENIKHLLILYRENQDTVNGTPFKILFQEEVPELRIGE